MNTRNRAHPIVIDKSPSSLVVACHECIGWSEVFTTRKAAQEAAVDHEIEFHPESFGMRTAARVGAHRSRAAQNVTPPPHD